MGANAGDALTMMTSVNSQRLKTTVVCYRKISEKPEVEDESKKVISSAFSLREYEK
jgi:hypothetical protein